MCWWCIFINNLFKRREWNSVIVLTLLLLYSSVSIADIFETLVMPGKVVESHKKYESECKRCHKKLGSKSESRLCLDCHERIATDVQYNKGFHGRAPGVKKGDCRACHTEHIGRKGDIVKFDPHVFDHKYTDLPLMGAHLQVSCTSCHKEKLKYRDASTQCARCHKKDNPHGSGLKKINRKHQSCSSCHTSKHWQDIQFRHNTTEFELKGKHEKIACIACHKNNQFYAAPKACYSCHAINDVHKGSQGKKCQNCHDSRSWKNIAFDHDRKTKFPLKGKHKKQDCNACHKGDPKKEKLDMKCISCHRQDDVHTTRLGTKCDKCHTEKDWAKNTFSHDADTKFPLRGRHRTTSCHACHKGNIKLEKLKTDCLSCHRLDDVHKSKQGTNCSQCHNEKSWHEKVIFEHDATRFPLMGLHAVTPCEECHVGSKYQSDKRECIACHIKKDIHKGTLGKNCQTCHTPNAWGIWVFDHNKQTEFKLTGRHTKISCKGCHYKPLNEMTSKVGDCISCHASDDQHHGQFGANCQRCHSTENFRDIKDFH